MAKRMVPINTGNGVMKAPYPPKGGGKPKVKTGKDLRVGK